MPVTSGARRARAVAARYSWERVFTRLFDLYREVIDDYRRP